MVEVIARVAGLAAVCVARIVRVTVLVVFVATGLASVAGSSVVVVVSVVTGAVSGAAGSAVVAGGGSAVTGWASWADKGVEESTRAAAIAGRVLARA